MMAFSVPAPLLLDHQLLVAKIANVGKLSFLICIKYSFSGFILFQKHEFSQSLVITLMKRLYVITFVLHSSCYFFPSICDPLVDPFFCQFYMIYLCERVCTNL
jgi:hypothetical protein